MTKAPTMKRSVPISRGRVYPILKRSAHVTVMIGVMEEKKATPKKEEGEVKEVKKKTTDKKAFAKPRAKAKKS